MFNGSVLVQILTLIIPSLMQGLWRVDDHDIAKLAAVTRSPRKQTGASTAEEGRGPHVALSVRLKRKDPDRQFHIGERISYILMANSSKLQVNYVKFDQFRNDIINGIPRLARKEKSSQKLPVLLCNQLCNIFIVFVRT